VSCHIGGAATAAAAGIVITLPAPCVGSYCGVPYLMELSETELADEIAGAIAVWIRER
jgi:hypothetical protein